MKKTAVLKKLTVSVMCACVSTFFAAPLMAVADDTSFQATASDDVCTDEVDVRTKENVVNLHASMESKDGTDKDLNKEFTKNPYNKAHDHSNPLYEKFYGAGDLEFNYWTNSGVKQQNIRVNFGTDQRIDGARLEVVLPWDDVENLIQSGKLKLENASEWLINRLFRGVSEYEAIDPNTMPEYEVQGNKIVFKWDSLNARMAGSFVFSRTFDTEEEFNNAIADAKATADLKGKYSFRYLVLPGDTSIYNYKMNEANDPIDLNTYKSRQKVFVDGDGQEVKNGYMVGEDITRTDVGKEGACNLYKVEKKITSEVNLNAKSKMDTRLRDYSNNGYLEKIINENNHSGGTEEYLSKLSGPGNLEVQHWQDGPNEGTKQQHWRFVFATDYAIENGKITAQLPYELAKNYTIENTSNWLVERYYPAVSGKKYYSDLNVVNKQNYVDQIQINGDKLTIDVGEIPARTALSFTIHQKFDTPMDFSNDIKEASIHVSGNWRLDERYISLPNTIETHTIQCGTCEVPVEPDKPVTPDKSVTPDKPSTPDPAGETKKTSVKKVNRVAPKTGDANNVLPYAAIGGLSLVALATAVIRKTIKK